MKRGQEVTYSGADFLNLKNQNLLFLNEVDSVHASVLDSSNCFWTVPMLDLREDKRSYEADERKQALEMLLSLKDKFNTDEIIRLREKGIL